MQDKTATRRRKTLPSAYLLTDTSEQRSWPLEGFASKHATFLRRTWNLPEGDYAAVLATEAGDINKLSLVGSECRTDTVIRNEALAINCVASKVCLIERKSMADLFGTLTHGRDRFIAELERMATYGFRALVIESDLPSIMRGTEHSRAMPQSIIASCIALSQRYGVHVCFCSDRRHAASYAFRLMERWVRDRSELSMASVNGGEQHEPASDIW